MKCPHEGESINIGTKGYKVKFFLPAGEWVLRHAYEWKDNTLRQPCGKR